MFKTIYQSAVLIDVTLCAWEDTYVNVYHTLTLDDLLQHQIIIELKTAGLTPSNKFGT